MNHQEAHNEILTVPVELIEKLKSQGVEAYEYTDFNEDALACAMKAAADEQIEKDEDLTRENVGEIKNKQAIELLEQAITIAERIEKNLVEQPTEDNIEEGGEIVDLAEIVDKPRVPVFTPRQELTAQEAADLCKILDTEEYGNGANELDPEYVERLLSKVQVSGMLDTDNVRAMNIDPAKVSAEELQAIIDIQEGREPTCDFQTLENALEKVSSGMYIGVDTPAQPIENLPAQAPVVENKPEQSGWSIFGFGQKKTEKTKSNCTIM